MTHSMIRQSLSRPDVSLRASSANIIKAVNDTLTGLLELNFVENEEPALVKMGYSIDGINHFCKVLERNVTERLPMAANADNLFVPWHESVMPATVVTSPLISICSSHDLSALNNAPSSLTASYIASMQKPSLNKDTVFWVASKHRASGYIDDGVFSLEALEAFWGLRPVAALMQFISRENTEEYMMDEVRKAEAMLALAPYFELLIRMPLNVDQFNYLINLQKFWEPPHQKPRCFNAWFWTAGLMAANLYHMDFETGSFVDLWGMIFFQHLCTPTNTASTGTKFSHPCMIAGFDIVTQGFPPHVEIGLKHNCGMAVNMLGTKVSTRAQMDRLVAPLISTFVSASTQERNSGLVFSFYPDTLDGLTVIGLAERANITGIHTQVLLTEQFYNHRENFMIIDYSHLDPEVIAELMPNIFAAGKCQAFFEKLHNYYDEIRDSGDRSQFLTSALSPEYQKTIQLPIVDIFVWNRCLNVIVVRRDHIQDLIAKVVGSNRDSYACSAANVWKQNPDSKNEFAGCNLCMEVTVRRDSVCTLLSINFAPWTPYDGAPMNEIIDPQTCQHAETLLANAPNPCFDTRRDNWSREVGLHRAFLTHIRRIAQTALLVGRGHTLRMRTPPGAPVGAFTALIKNSQISIDIGIGTLGEAQYISGGQDLLERTALFYGAIDPAYHVIQHPFSTIDVATRPNSNYQLEIPSIAHVQAAGTKRINHPIRVSEAEVRSAIRLESFMGMPRLKFGAKPTKVPPSLKTTAAMPQSRLRFLTRTVGQIPNMPLIWDTVFNADTRTGTGFMDLPALVALAIAMAPTPHEFNKLWTYIKTRVHDNILSDRFLRISSLSTPEQLRLYGDRQASISQAISIVLFKDADTSVRDILCYAHEVGLVTSYYYVDARDTSMETMALMLFGGTTY